MASELDDAFEKEREKQERSLIEENERLSARLAEAQEIMKETARFIEKHSRFAQPAEDMGLEPADEFTFEAAPVVSSVRAFLAKTEPTDGQT